MGPQGGEAELGASGIAWVSSAELLEALPVGEAADALTEALRDPSGLPEAPLRSVIDSGTGKLLSMPAAGRGGAGAKLVTLQPANRERGLPLIHGVFVLFSADLLQPVAVFDGAAITALRAPAVSVVAARFLAREDCRRMVLFGSGVQARAHAFAMLAARPLELVTVVAPGATADDLVRDLREAGVMAERGEPSDVAAADLVCTCTSAAEPLFDGASLAAGAHVSAMGSYRPEVRELDDEVLSRSALVAVDDLPAALSEAGDICIPVKAGTFNADRVAGDLGGIVRGEVRRSGEQEITTFKSVGAAWQDLVLARAAWDRIGSSR